MADVMVLRVAALASALLALAPVSGCAARTKPAEPRGAAAAALVPSGPETRYARSSAIAMLRTQDIRVADRLVKERGGAYALCARSTHRPRYLVFHFSRRIDEDAVSQVADDVVILRDDGRNEACRTLR